MGTQQTSPLTWLVETKFHPPLLRKDAIHRRRLLDDLYNELASHPLALLSAPAGYGKTTLLAALPPSYPDLSLAWLSLDQEDNDPVCFLTALIAALQRLNPACGVTTQSLIADNASPGVEAWRVTSVLINDVLETLSDPFALPRGWRRGCPIAHGRPTLEPTRSALPAVQPATGKTWPALSSIPRLLLLRTLHLVASWANGPKPSSSRQCAPASVRTAMRLTPSSCPGMILRSMPMTN